jgi:tRNA(Arg) A34 adenosine deaminase TadA
MAKNQGDEIMTPIHGHDAEHLRRAMGLALEARGRGNAPFGAVLVGEDGRILAEGQNTVDTERDVTGHAETNLIRAAFHSLNAGTLAASTLYASAEPCAMCSGAIFWSGVGRVVYGLSAERIYEMFPPDEAHPVMRLPCRDVLAAGTRQTEVIGPMLEEEAKCVFNGLA